MESSEESLMTDKQAKDNLQEVFIMPTNLKLRATMNNQKLYGSKKLDASYLKALSKSGRTKPYISKFEKLVDKKIIRPCFIGAKRVAGFYAWKIFGESTSKHIMGCFYPKSKQIYILINNQSNWFGYTSNNFLAKLTVHELMHRTAFMSGMSFISKFGDELGDFYGELWSEIFSIKKKKLRKNTVLPIVGFLFKNFELSKGFSRSSFTKEQVLLKRELFPLSNMLEDEFDRKLRKYMEVQILFLGDTKRFYQLKGDYEEILWPLYLAYKRAFNEKNLTTMAIQELFAPSEVMCIYSEKSRKASTVALSRI